MPTQIQFRRGTAAQWTAANPLLGSGELGYETDTGKIKVGDGATLWNSLSYQAIAQSQVTNLTSDLAAKAPLASPALTGTPTAPTAPVLTNTTQIATTAFVNAEIANDAVLQSGGSTITVSTGSTVPLTIQNNGTGNSFVVNDEASDSSPFVVDAAGNVAIGGTTTTALRVYRTTTDAVATIQGLTTSSSGTGKSALQLDVNGHGGFGIMNNATSGTRTLVIDSNSGTAGSGNTVLTITDSGRVRLPAGGILEAPVSTNAQTTSYTLVLADAGRLIEINNAGATTLTIPADASVAFPVGTKIDVLQTGAGQVTIAGSGFTPNATPGLKISAQWGAASLVKRGTNSWVVIGNLSA